MGWLQLFGSILFVADPLPWMLTVISLFRHTVTFFGHGERCGGGGRNNGSKRNATERTKRYDLRFSGKWVVQRGQERSAPLAWPTKEEACWGTPPPVHAHCTRHSRACPVPNCPVPFPPCLPQCQMGPHLVPTNTWKMHEITQRRNQLSHKTFPHRLGGNVCPARARRATFLLTIPTSAPGLPSHGEALQVDHIALHTFPIKHVA